MESVYEGLDLTYTLDSNLGLTYRLAYKVSNVLGWSELSPVAFILAATIPQKPCCKPLLVNVDAS